MIVALIDNGSLEPAAHRNLRQTAREISERTDTPVEAVSWKHSNRIRPDLLDRQPAAVLATWLREHFLRGERDFVFTPFFISPQGAIGSALVTDIAALRDELGDLRFTFTRGLTEQNALTNIVAARIREIIANHTLSKPAVVVVDHGGPSPVSAALRNQIAREVERCLVGEIGIVGAASLEGAEYVHNQPLFADILTVPGFDRGDVVIAPLFLAPGRHAGPRGDLAEIAMAAEDRLTAAPLHCHFTELVGTHPDVVPALATALTQTLSTLYVAA